jgi:protein-S-isoprenylcysteine O-methyltransferase Ste14
MLKVRGPNIRVPPAIFGAGFLIGLWLEGAVARIPLMRGDAWLSPAQLGWTIAVVGFVISLWGIVTFRRAHTTMFPFEPATRVVREGPYRFTRNPMYVGGTLTYIGIAIAMNVAWPLLLLPLVLWALFVLVIRAEEHYLADAFGEDYASYRKRVRRWI